MSQKSTIEWTDATWNPVRGCRKVSPGCKHCYAETFAERFRGVPGHPYEQGFDMRLVPHKLLEPLTMLKPRTIFVNSMSDLFQDQVPEEYIRLAFEVMLAADWHTYQVLTKRAERMAALTRLFPFDLRRFPHIWLGVSVEDKKYGVPRIDHLRQARAAVRFLSVEPLLEDIGRPDLTGVDWVIVGGESGPGARPMKPEWVRSLRSQCEAAQVAFFFKQWGGVRKKKTGRMLDGRTWDELPERASQPVPPRSDIEARRGPLEAEICALVKTLDTSIVFPATIHSKQQKNTSSRPKRTAEGSGDTKKAKAMPLNKTQRQRILQRLADEMPKQDIADELGVSKAQVAAVAAHVTMGTYELPLRSREPKASRVAGRAAKGLPAPRPAEAKPAEAKPAVAEPAVAEPSGPPDREGVLLGATEDGRSVLWSPFPNSSTPNPHVLILGGSGSGKTYATLCLLAELSRRGIPSFVFDYGQGFTRASLPAAFKAIVDPVEYAVARSGLSLNPLRITKADILGPVNVAQRFADSMQRVYRSIGIQQHAALRQAVLDSFSRFGITEDPNSWRRQAPTLAELQRTLQADSEDTENPNRRHVASVAAHIASLFVFNTFRSSGLPLDWQHRTGEGRGDVSILQLRGLEPSLERATTELLLWDLWSDVERRGAAKEIRSFVVLDEAHNLPMQPGSPVEKILREGRKFGLGMIVASQQPEDFPAVAFSNTATKLLFRLSHDAAATAKKLFPRNPKRKAQIAEALGTLGRGQALTVAGGEPIKTNIVSLEARASVRGPETDNRPI